MIVATTVSTFMTLDIILKILAKEPIQLSFSSIITTEPSEFTEYLGTQSLLRTVSKEFETTNKQDYIQYKNYRS